VYGAAIPASLRLLSFIRARRRSAVNLVSHGFRESLVRSRCRLRSTKGSVQDGTNRRTWLGSGAAASENLGTGKLSDGFTDHRKCLTPCLRPQKKWFRTWKSNKCLTPEGY